MTKGEETKRKILICATKEFGTHGLHLATLDQIAKKSKVPKPLIIYYFENKTNLLKASIASVFDNFATLNVSKNFDNLTGTEKIHSIFEGNLELAKKHPDSTRLVIMLYSNATWDSEFAELYTTVADGARNRYAGFLKSAAREQYLVKDIDFESAARMIHYWIIGAMTDFLKDDGSLKAEKRARADWLKFIGHLFSAV